MLPNSAFCPRPSASNSSSSASDECPARTTFFSLRRVAAWVVVVTSRRLCARFCPRTSRCGRVRRTNSSGSGQCKLRVFSAPAPPETRRENSCPANSREKLQENFESRPPFLSHAAADCRGDDRYLRVHLRPLQGQERLLRQAADSGRQGCRPRRRRRRLRLQVGLRDGEQRSSQPRKKKCAGQGHV